MPAIVGILFLIIYLLVLNLVPGLKAPSQKTFVNIPNHFIPAATLEQMKPRLKAGSAVVFDTKSGARVFDYNGEQVRPIASLTKLMTALVFLDHNPGWDKTVVIATEDLRGGAKANIFVGDRIKVNDLFTAGLIASDNSAIAALVRSTGLKEEEFVAQMNLKVKELRMSNAHFADPTGLNPDNKATAVGVAKLAERALANQEITNALKIYTFRFKVSESVDREVTSTNQLLGRIFKKSVLIAGKTGHLNEAGYCFAGSFKSGQRQFITVVLGAPEDSQRFSETLDILDWTLGAYLWDNSK